MDINTVEGAEGIKTLMWYVFRRMGVRFKVGLRGKQQVPEKVKSDPTKAPVDHSFQLQTREKIFGQIPIDTEVVS